MAKTRLIRKIKNLRNIPNHVKITSLNCSVFCVVTVRAKVLTHFLNFLFVSITIVLSVARRTCFHLLVWCIIQYIPYVAPFILLQVKLTTDVFAFKALVSWHFYCPCFMDLSFLQQYQPFICFVFYARNKTDMITSFTENPQYDVLPFGVRNVLYSLYCYKTKMLWGYHLTLNMFPWLPLYTTVVLKQMHVRVCIFSPTCPCLGSNIMSTAQRFLSLAACSNWSLAYIGTKGLQMINLVKLKFITSISIKCGRVLKWKLCSCFTSVEIMIQ